MCQYIYLQNYKYTLKSINTWKMLHFDRSRDVHNTITDGAWLRLESYFEGSV